MGAIFLYDGNRYTYSFKYDVASHSFTEEQFAQIIVDKYGNESIGSFFERRVQEKVANSSSVDLEKIINLDDEDEKAKGIYNKDRFMDLLKLISIKKGKPLPSIIFDSLGTKKIVSLAGYLVDSLNKGKILIVDELDSGLHFKLTRSIISLFNNILNEDAQLIFSTHDTSLLDTKTMFRKEQIWFTNKDETQVYLYSLSNFTSQNSGIRLGSNLYEPYFKGVFGGISNPSFE